MTDDITSAARRVAVYIRARSQFSDGDNPLLPDLVALLPVLDALAAGAGADRVERWARGLCAAAGHEDPDQPYAGGKLWEKWEPVASSAIALAEAGRVAETRKAPPG